MTDRFKNFQTLYRWIVIGLCWSGLVIADSGNIKKSNDTINPKAMMNSSLNNRKKFMNKVVNKNSSVGLKKRSIASDTPIEVKGQSRNLNMLLILQSQNEAIDFIKLRKDYQYEVKRMSY